MYRDRGDRYLRRGLAYAAKVMDDQRGLPGWKGYSSTCKVFAIWVLFEPHRTERNAVVRHRMEGAVESRLHRPTPESLDLIDLVTVGIGHPDDAETEDMRSFDALFYKKIGRRKQERILKEAFKLSPKDGLLILTRGWRMSLDKEFENHWKRIGRKEGVAIGVEKGVAIGVEKGVAKGRAEEREKTVEMYADSVLAIMKEKGDSLEDSMRYVPSQISNLVRKRVEDRLAKAIP